jgi:hypothetical protein
VRSKPEDRKASGLRHFYLYTLEQRAVYRVRGPGWSVEVVEYAVTLISDGTRLQVDQALAQGPQAKKGRARETEACCRRPRARQQPTAEQITEFGRCPLSRQHERARHCRVLAGTRQELPVPCWACRTKFRGFAVRGSGRDVAASRFGPRFRRFAGMASARDVVCPPVRTKVSGFGDDQLRGRARRRNASPRQVRCQDRLQAGGAERSFQVVSNADQSQSQRWDWPKLPTWQSD